MSSKNECKIFVGNVPFQCTREDFVKCFAKYDGFLDGDIVNRFNADNCRGFGFITFKNPTFAENFISKNEKIILKNRVLRFTKYSFSNKKIGNRTYHKNYLFIRNVPKNYTPDNIKKIFEKYGEVGSCFINTNNITGESKGTAVVELKNNEIFNKLLSDGEVTDNEVTLLISKWKQKLKIRRQVKTPDIKDVYRVAFNAGRNMGLLEGLKIVAKNDHKDSDEE